MNQSEDGPILNFNPRILLVIIKTEKTKYKKIECLRRLTDGSKIDFGQKRKNLENKLFLKNEEKMAKFDYFGFIRFGASFI